MGAKIIAGIVGGVAGGIVFGAMMQAMGMLGMVAGLVDAEGAGAGWAVHLVISVAIGIGYSLTLGALRSGMGAHAVLGLAYGAIWWVLGPLLLMPLMMGMGPFPSIGEDQIMSLVGHLVYGLVLGVVFAGIQGRVPVGAGQDTSVLNDR